MINYKKVTDSNGDIRILFKLINNEMVASLPSDPNNIDYIEYLEWLKNGNEVEEYIMEEEL